MARVLFSQLEQAAPRDVVFKSHNLIARPSPFADTGLVGNRDNWIARSFKIICGSRPKSVGTRQLSRSVGVRIGVRLERHRSSLQSWRDERTPRTTYRIAGTPISKTAAKQKINKVGMAQTLADRAEFSNSRQAH